VTDDTDFTSESGCSSESEKSYVRFQVLMAACMKVRIFWDVLPCS
jgi:hypothetical protein